MSEKINGGRFQAMVIEAAECINDRRQEANELNVFPVPDGDTGTNMSLTMGAARREMDKLDAPTLTQAADAAAAALLRGARGNSGVILSLLFRGFAKRLKGLEEADGFAFAEALSVGVDTAYKAVMKPAEGTILTVSRALAEAACAAAQRENGDVAKVMRAAIERAHEALALTPTQNPVLAKANVVDAGAFGFIVILEGMENAYHGRTADHQVQAERTDDAASFSGIDDEEITFTYCTEFIVIKADREKNSLPLRAYLESIGDSAVVVDDEDIIKVHVHTDTPNLALGEGLKYGALTNMKIDNMREQHFRLAAKERVVAEPVNDYGFVSVAAGDGMASIFRDLGVDQVVQGGQTMNPSTDDILHAIDAVPAKTVFVLPNNKNIIMAAEQAIPLSEKQVIVLPSKTIPQGISAMLVFDASADAEVNRAAMTEAMADVRTGQVTYAARDSLYDDRKIKEGEFIALHEGKLCTSGRKRIDVIKKLARELLAKKNASFITIIYGEGVTEEQADEVRALFEQEAKGAEVNILNGGQPVYYYIISVE